MKCPAILGSVKSVKSVNSQKDLFFCEVCDYQASKKHHLLKHYLTRKTSKKCKWSLDGT